MFLVSIVLLHSMAASVSGSQTGDCEDIESAGSYLLQVSHRLNISSRLDENVHQRNYIYSVGSHACSWESFYFMLAGMLISTMLFLLLGWCARTGPPQMLVGEAHLSGVEQPAKKDSTKPPHIGALDGLRGIFIVWIVFWHQMMHDTVFDAPATMQFFFVVSGFVNVKAIERQRTRFDWIAGLLFILKRCCRLFPMYWLGMLLMAGKYKFLKQDWGLCPAGRWFTESIGIHSWFGILSYNMPWCCVGSTPSWFVSALLPMTLCFPMLYNILPSREGTTSCLILMIIFVRSTYFLLPPLKTSRFVDFQSPYPHFPEFFVGMLCAVWCRQVLPHIPSWSGWACLFDASLLLAYLVIVARNSGTPPSGDYGLTCFFCIMCVSASAMAESPFPRFWPRQGLVGHILNCGPLQFLARYAYSIYILQWPVLALSQDFLPRWAFDRFAAVPLAILFGICADVVIDQPIQRVLDRYLRDAAK
mmetsp:Transcript_39062/g.83208  ORF Transcript_39062/g.83208 Transcript_39062/m.83208 type:complete len:474 (+) Transcript_39062:80-1501(+)